MHQPIPRLVVEFTKMHGAGNDFIVVDNRFFHFSDEELSELARRFCHRRFGIGADGLLAFNSPLQAGHHGRMRYFNADGSRGTMCGNGIRCLAQFARRGGVEASEMSLETDAGVVRADVPPGEGRPVRIYLAPPEGFEPHRELSPGASKETGPVHGIWTGTEHVVCFVPDAEAVPVERWGAAIRLDEALRPAGANVDFVEVAGIDALHVRTFEKGVESETYACGTGAVASAVVARLLGLVHVNRVDVHMRGGTLTVGWTFNGEAVQDLFLEGPVETVFRGTFEM